MDKRTSHIYMLPTRDSLKVLEHTQTKSEGMERDVPYKWGPKES